MPGIYGYIKKQQDEKQLKRMMKALFHQKYFLKDDDFVDAKIEASHLHLGNMKKDTSAFFKNGIYISIEGEQYDFKQSNFEELLFDAYLNSTLESFLNKLDGYFNAVIYDSNLKKVFLISDRYGMRMLYYYYKDGRFAFSGEVKGLLGLDFVDPIIDKKQINCFMDLGYLLEDNTYHTYIKLIKPATIMEFDIDSETLIQKYYWKWSEIKPQKISFSDAVDQLGIAFLDAVKKRFNVDDRVGIALSGGLDSRAIFAAVNKLYPSFKGYAFTFGIPKCDDIKIAKQCVVKTNWQHKEFYFSNDNWLEPRKEKVWFTDGMLSLMHMHGSEFLDEISDNIAFNLHGYAGDVVFGGGWFNTIPCDTRGTNLNLVKFYKKYIDLCIIEDNFYDINKCEPHLYMNRVRRFTNMGTTNGLMQIDMRKPFFDNKVIELVYSIPDYYRKNNKLYSAMLLKFFPELFHDIPWHTTGKLISEKDTKLNKLIRKFKRIPIKLGMKKDTDSFTDYRNWIRDPKISNNIMETLDYKFTTKYVIPHLNNKRDFSEIILRKMTIELYLKYLKD